MTVLLLNEEDVRRLLTMDLALAAVEEGLRRLALDEGQNAPRQRTQTDHAMLHVLSAQSRYSHCCVCPLTEEIESAS